MNQHDQMLREALRNNIRGFLCERTGMFKFVLSDAECHEGWKEMMLIPNLPNEVIDSVLAAEPAPLVRLTDEKIEEIGRKILDRGYPWEGLQPWVYVFANAIMDAMERLNGQPTASEHRDYRVKTQALKRPLPPPTTEKI